MVSKILLSILSFSTMVACNSEKNYKVMSSAINMPIENTDTATFATGCFWCTEALFEQVAGVVKVTSGYGNGNKNNPTYEEVCSGETGFAECIQVVYEPAKVSYDDLLEVFFEVHDPTSLNRQGADAGTQYRSGIFYQSAVQKERAVFYKAELAKSNAYNKPIVTEIAPLKNFYPAEAYHQEYYRNNKNTNPYCSIVIRPKIEKFQKVFANKMKPGF